MDKMTISKEKLGLLWLAVWLVMCAVSTDMDAQNTINMNLSTKSKYEKLWKDVERFRKLDQPKSAGSVARVIYAKAVQEQNMAQTLKAGLTIAGLRESVSPDSVVRDVEQLETLLQRPLPVAEQALAHALLGSVYAQMRNSSLTYTNQDAEQVYVDKAKAHFKAALAHKDSLAGVSAKAYEPLYEVGNDGRLFHDDVLSLLVDFVSEQVADAGFDEEDNWRSELLETVTAVYDRHGMRDAALLMRLKTLALQHTLEGKARLKDKDYAARLRQLYEKNLDIEAGADACACYLNAVGSNLTGQQKADLATWAQRQWPKSKLLPTFKNMVIEAHQPMLNISFNPIAYGSRQLEPTDERVLPVVLRHQNVGRVELIVFNNIGTSEQRKRGDEVCRQTVTFQHFLTHKNEAEEVQKDTVEMRLPVGQFLVVARADGLTDTTDVHVTSLHLSYVVISGNKRMACVVDDQSGQPVAGCTIHGWRQGRVGREWKETEEHFVTDADGLCEIPDGITALQARRNAQDFTERQWISGNGVRRNSINETQTHESVFTDRAIYRPGQIVHVSGLVYTQQGDETQVVSDRPVNVTLRDANYQVVGEQQVSTDAFGMAAVDFTLPKNRLNGQFSVQFGSQRTYFRVEEYKRPTFVVEFDKYEGNYSLGDSVQLTGRVMTFSGVPVQDARVKYTTLWSKSTFWSWVRRGEREADSGELTTDDEGRFCISVYLDDSLVEENEEEENDMSAGLSERAGNVFNFRVKVDVTDVAGESQQAETLLRASITDFALSVDMPAEINLSETNPIAVQPKAQNADRQPLTVEGEWQLRGYDLSTRDFSQTVARGAFVSGQALQLAALQTLSLGSYLLVLESHDSKGHLIRITHDFVVWNSEAAGQEMQLQQDFLISEHTDFEVGQGIDLWYAVARPNAYTYLYIASQDGELLRKIEVKNPQLTHLHLDYQPEFGDGVLAGFFYVQDGADHQRSVRVLRKEPDKELKLTWKTFRDKLTPGQQETWILHVEQGDRSVVPAQLMATLYDASLDEFAKLAWPFGVSFVRSVPFFALRSGNALQSGYLSVPYVVKYHDTYSRSFNRLKPYEEYVLGGIRFYRLYDARPMLMSKASVLDGRIAGVEAADVEADTSADELEPEDNGIGEKQNEPEPSNRSTTSAQQVRQNFDETAFFYPNLETDGRGDVQISFTLPESLTEWRFMGLAHTKDICYGTIESTAVARKDFMVIPNLPRFVRVGDRMSIASRIINTSAKSVSGTARMRLIDPEAGKTVFSEEKKFSVEAGQTAPVTFDYAVTDDYPMLVCEVTAGNKHFSDGERNWLPVLTDRQIVTEALPFFIDGAGSKTIDLEPLFNHHSSTATRRTMTFEYTDNPSWTAVMALHAVVNPTDDSAIDWAAALYANSVAQSLASRMPRLQSLIQQWNAETEQETTLQSELEKNVELKDILLQETPWVLDSQDETEQRHKLCELFDTNLLESRIAKAKSKLGTLQYANGGWSWFDGMKPNAYVTLAVCEQLAMLQQYLSQHGGVDAEVKQMLGKGVRFTDAAELEYYSQYYKKASKALPAETSCRWLYMRTLAQQADASLTRMDAAVTNMKQDYLNRVEGRVGELTMYGRANIAVVLLNENRKAAARDFVQSLREYLVEKNGMGMYFDTEKAYYSWMDYRMPTHLATMRAFFADSADLPDAHRCLVQMQLWLLRQKQVQKWDNIINTIGVCDMLLSVSPEISFHESRRPEVSFDGTPFAVSSPNAGIGYSKTPVPARQAEARQLTVTKSSDGISWGCVYGQCEESLDQLKATDGSLTISRQILISMTDNGKTVWRPLAEGAQLHVGDKIRIRHTVTSDRDMDFVQIRSQHAACLEPLRALSGYQFLGGRGGYLSLHDASADIFFDTYRKGTSTVDLDFYVVRAGTYSQGVAKVQCAYAPAFSGHSDGCRMQVSE